VTFPLASSVYRLADSEVLIAVAQTPDGPAPLFTDIGGEITCVAYTDLREAQSDVPSTHRLFSIVVAELLGQLPEHVGLVVDPRAASPVHVGAQDKARISAAARPFPNGVQVAIGDPAEEPAALTTRLRELAPAAAAVRRMWRTWYQVADAREKLLVVYDVEGQTGADAQAADLIVDAARSTDYPRPLIVLALDDLPSEHRQWLLANTPPFYERQR
jgi:hypothetical protein